MLGNFHDDVINIECETSSADLYVVDAEGIYIENIAMHSYLESDVIDAINAKYGTNFTQLTMQKVTGIAIGDDCPNWAAYEKIKIKLEDGYYKYQISNSQEESYVAMVCISGIIRVYVATQSVENAIIIYKSNGTVKSASGSIDIIEQIKTIADAVYEYNGIQRQVTGNSPISNWSQYVDLI